VISWFPNLLSLKFILYRYTEEGRMYADLAPEVRAAYLRPTKAEGWDQGLLQLFRSGGAVHDYVEFSLTHSLKGAWYHPLGL
jgi:hypothetical protein